MRKIEKVKLEGQLLTGLMTMNDTLAMDSVRASVCTGERTFFKRRITRHRKC